MTDNNKLIAIAGALGAVLIILIIITSLFGAFSQKSKTDESLTPTPFERSKTGASSVTSSGNTGSTADQITNDSTGNPISNPQEVVKEIRGRSSSLSSDDKRTFDAAKNQTPIETKDFAVAYNPSVDQFILSQKTENGDLELAKWLESTGLLHVAEKRPDIVVKTDLPLVEYEFLTEKFADDPANLPPESLPLEVRSQVYGQGSPAKDVQLLSDLFKTLMSFNLGSATLQTDSTTQIPPAEEVSLGQTGSISGKALASKDFITRACLANMATYTQAQNMTGVPWYVLASIHYREGSCGRDRSLANGSIIRSGTLLDSAIAAGNLLKAKIGGKVPQTIEETAKAAGRYNGIGNRNCGKSPYTHCPPQFENSDHNYAMNFYDASHDTMFIIYCFDGRKCNPPKIDPRPGVTAAVRLLTNQ